MKEVPDQPVGEVYLRKSRAMGDPDDPELLAHHRAALLRLAAADGVHIPPENIIEEIGSAERIADRPAFRRRMAHWQQRPPGAGGIIYVTEVSRLTRGSSSEWGQIEETLRRAGIKIRTRSRLFDLSNPEDCNYLEIEALFGRMELRYMKMRAAAKRVEMVREGMIRTGAAPWGYRWDKLGKRLMPDPERFPVLQRLCREILTVSAHRLAQLYGIPQSSLLWTLRNPAICGWPAQRYSSGTAARRGTAARLPRAEWIWPERPGAYPPACTRAEWDAIQAALDRRYLRREKTGANDGWCRDVVRFQGCEGRVSLGAVRPPGQAGYYSYDLHRPGLPRLYVSRDLVHSRAEAALGALFARPAVFDLALSAYDRMAHSRHDHQQGQGRDAETLRRLLARERGRLAGLKGEEWDPEIGPEERLSNLTAQNRARQAIDSLKAELQARERQGARLPELEAVRDELLAMLQSWSEVWAECPEDVRRSVANACLEAVYITVEATGRRPFQRAVTGVSYRDWLRPFLE